MQMKNIQKIELKYTKNLAQIWHKVRIKLSKTCQERPDGVQRSSKGMKEWWGAPSWERFWELGLVGSWCVLYSQNAPHGGMTARLLRGVLTLHLCDEHLCCFAVSLWMWGAVAICESLSPSFHLRTRQTGLCLPLSFFISLSFPLLTR